MNEKSIYKLSSKIGSPVLGAILILLGLMFLAGRYVSVTFKFDVGHYAWPFFIIVQGAFLFLTSFVVERRPGLAAAVLGAMLTTVGCILLVQNIFDIYASWAYAWALVAPTSVGLAKLAHGALRGMREEIRSGLALSGIGLAIFIIGAVFFELVIGINGFHFGAAWLCWPGLLIGVGVILVLSTLLRRQSQPLEGRS
jgi:cell wall-active antibiotic response 4TMS protein YvqF